MQSPDHVGGSNELPGYCRDRFLLCCMAFEACITSARMSCRWLPDTSLISMTAFKTYAVCRMNTLTPCLLR